MVCSRRTASTGYADDSKKEREKVLQGFSDRIDTFFNQLDQRVQHVENQYKRRMQELGNSTAALIEKQQKNVHYMENVKFIFLNAMFVAIAVVLIRALFYGVWEGLFVKDIYEWGSQWEWLQYTMWGLFGAGLGVLIVHVYLLIKSVLYPRL